MPYGNDSFGYNYFSKKKIYQGLTLLTQDV